MQESRFGFKIGVQNIGVQNPKFKRHQLSNGEYIRYPEIKNQNPSEQFRSWIGFGMVWDFGPAGELPLVWWGGVLKSPTLSSWWAWVRGELKQGLNGERTAVDHWLCCGPKEDFRTEVERRTHNARHDFWQPHLGLSKPFKGCQCKKPSVWAISAVSGFGDMMQNGIGRGIPVVTPSSWEFRAIGDLLVFLSNVEPTKMRVHETPQISSTKKGPDASWRARVAVFGVEKVVI